MDVTRDHDGGSTITLLRPEVADVANSLVVVIGTSIEAHNLPEKGSLTIGRSPTADVVLQHKSVSREHAILEVGPTSVTLRDLGSHNGTRLAGHPLSKGASVTLREGEVVQLGAVNIFLESRRVEKPEDDGSDFDPEQEGIIVGPWLLKEWPILARISKGDIPILLLGETGVGKEVLANLVHRCSRRAEKTMLSVNCTTLPENLVESELFGHERGAFTGANSAKKGLLEGVNGGTLFLDEIGELPLQMQSKLLRVLETCEYRRVGGLNNLTADVRFVAATNRDLDKAAAEGDFRADLLYRINAFTLEVPPLRQRRDEIIPLARRFAESASSDQGSPTPVISSDAVEALENHDWPGNIRELKNIIKRAVLFAGTSSIGREHLPENMDSLSPEADQVTPPTVEPPSQRPADLRDAVQEAERQMIIDALAECAGNQTQAAVKLGISRRTLVDRLNKYDLPRPRKRGKQSKP